MNSILIYRASFYLMLTVATTILCGDATDSRLDWFLPSAAGAAAVLAFFTVDQSRRWGLPRDLANILAVGTLGLLFLEYRSDETQVIRCLGHWMIYLQLIKYFLPKTSEDDWFLFLLGLTQVLIGSVINQSDMVGPWLFFWAMLAVWVLGLFFLQREITGSGARRRPAQSAARRPRIPIAACSTFLISERRCGRWRSPWSWAVSFSCCCPARLARRGQNHPAPWPST